MPDTSDTSATRATRMQHECDTNNASVTRVRYDQHECDTSVTRVRHEWYKNDTSTARVKNFDFDNDTSKNIFSHPYIYYMASERLQGDKQFLSKNFLLEMPRFRAKMHLKSAPQKLNVLMGKAISKRFTLDCSWIIKDSTDKMSIAIFESLIEKISEGICYDMTMIRVQRYLDKRILKTTITSEVFSNNNIDVPTNDNDDIYIFPDETKSLVFLFQTLHRNSLFAS